MIRNDVLFQSENVFDVIIIIIVANVLCMNGTLRVCDLTSTETSLCGEALLSAACNTATYAFALHMHNSALRIALSVAVGAAATLRSLAGA